MAELDFLRGISVDLKVLEPETWVSRSLSQLKNYFSDQSEANRVLQRGDPVIYRYQSLPLPVDAGDLSFGISTVLPGTIGNEFYMTKGHFHEALMTAEVYYCLSGEGGLLIENEEGDTRLLHMSGGKLIYVPKGYAHRTVNTGNTPISSLFVFRADAGHDYKTIETRGYRKLVISSSNGPMLVDNPRWY